MNSNIYAFEGLTPVVDPSAYVHPTAVLIGDVIVGAGCYVGPGAVMRGDFGRIELRRGANLQDNCVVHSRGDVECLMEEDSHIGHGAVIHACRIGRDSLVGMNAVVMDLAHVGDQAVVAAMSFVKIRDVVAPRTLVAGIPARFVRHLTDANLENKQKGTQMYKDLAQRCRTGLVPAVALVAIESDRRRSDWTGYSF
ncbi:MAG: phenylacetic acid degradation protein PaaY [Lautropia sp.]|nr:phenylacetic acid degradation protein PaaY [Lautropia sp.]